LVNRVRRMKYIEIIGANVFGKPTGSFRNDRERRLRYVDTVIDYIVRRAGHVRRKLRAKIESLR